MFVNRRTGKRGRPQVFYVCSTHRTRGATACTAKHGVLAADIEPAVVTALRGILTPERLDEVLRGYVAACAEGEQASERQGALTAELAAIEAELSNLTAALARFGADAPASVLDGIKQRERSRADVRARLEHVDGILKAATETDRSATLSALRS